MELWVLVSSSSSSDTVSSENLKWIVQIVKILILILRVILMKRISRYFIKLSAWCQIMQVPRFHLFKLSFLVSVIYKVSWPVLVYIEFPSIVLHSTLPCRAYEVFFDFELRLVIASELHDILNPSIRLLIKLTNRGQCEQTIPVQDFLYRGSLH